MLTPSRSNTFKREFKLMTKRGKNPDKFHEVASVLIHELDLKPEHRDHKLHGRFEGRRECHIEPDWLLVYAIKGSKIIFERTGTHSDLFG
jgi:mRNA interferase YafQ